MYNDDRALRATAPVISRFENWLRSHGYELARDPFMAPAFDEATDDAADLVGEYLNDRPAERNFQDVLLEHAQAIGDVYPVLGDCGFAFALAS